eukprot:s1831_g7.t1
MQMMQMQQMQQMVGVGMMMGNMFNMMNATPSFETITAGAAQLAQPEPARVEEIHVPPGPSSTLGHPNYRPADSEQIPGVTDTRFEGKIKVWWDSKGHGLIECEEVRLKFPGQDGVFLHDSQRRHFRKGDEVSFAVFVNFRGRPQATELRRPEEDAKKS